MVNHAGDTRAAFGQPSAVCTEIETIFVADPAVSSVCMMSSLAPLVTYLQKMGDVFSIHTKKQYSLEEGLKVLESVLCYLKNISEKVRNTFKLQGIMQGPQGVMYSNILLSIEMMITSLKSIFQEFSELRQKFVMKAFTTLVNEHFFSRVRQERLTPETLDFAQIFTSVVTELINRIPKLPFLFFSHPHSYYEVPEDYIPFDIFPTIKKGESPPITKENEALLPDYRCAYLQSVKQMTIRNQTTKDKSNILPLYAYESETPKPTILNIKDLLFSDNEKRQQKKSKVMIERGALFYLTGESMLIGIVIKDVLESEDLVKLKVCVHDDNNVLIFKFYEERIVKTKDLSNRLELSEGDLDSEEFQLTEKEYEQISSLECLGDVDDCNPEENDTETEAGRNIDGYLTDSSQDLIFEEIFNERLMRSSRTSKAPKHLNDFVQWYLQ